MYVVRGFNTLIINNIIPISITDYKLKSVPDTDLCLIAKTIYNFIVTILNRIDVMARFA